MSKTKTVNASDLSAATKLLTLDGKQYRLTFNCDTFRMAEEVYEVQYRRDLNFSEIIALLARNKLSAIMALFYAAMNETLLLEGRDLMDYGDFCCAFKLDSIPGVTDALLQGVGKALPDVDGDDDVTNDDDPQ